jgi:hypothetical protein
MAEFIAKEWMDPDGVIVSSGERLALAILPALHRGESVVVHTEGLEGLSSSYFNIVLNIIRDELGPASLSRVAFECASPIHRAMLERSIFAAMNPQLRNIS